MRKWNFCAGPAAISEDVLQEVKSELLEFNNSGASIMEISHRSEVYSSVAREAKSDLIEILNILQQGLGVVVNFKVGYTYKKRFR